MAEVTGIIQDISTTQRGSYVMADIVVGGEKYGAGISKYLKAKVGDYVKFELDDSRGFKNVAKGTLKVSQGKPPAEAVAEASSTKANVARAVSGFDARQDAISRQAASNTAIAWVTFLASQDALPKAKTKGAAADMLDSVRRQYEKEFYESNTGHEFKDIGPKREAAEAAEDAGDEDQAAAPADTAWK